MAASQLGLVGHVCGKKHFGARWDEAEKVYQKEAMRR